MQKPEFEMPDLSNNHRRITQNEEVRGVEQPGENQSDELVNENSTLERFRGFIPSGLIDRLLPSRDIPQERLLQVLQQLTTEINQENPVEDGDNQPSSSPDIRTYPAPKLEDLIRDTKKAFTAAINQQIKTFRSSLAGAMTDPKERRILVSAVLNHAMVAITMNYKARLVLDSIRQDGFALTRRLLSKGFSVKDFKAAKLATHFTEIAEFLKSTNDLIFLTEDFEIRVAPSLEKYKEMLLKGQDGFEFINDEDLITHVMGRIYLTSFIKRAIKEIDSKLDKIFQDVSKTANPQTVVQRLQRERRELAEQIKREEEQVIQNGGAPSRYYLTMAREPFPSDDNIYAQILFLKMAISEQKEYIDLWCNKSRVQAKF